MKKSEHCIFAAGDYDAEQTSKIPETAVVSAEIGNEFDHGIGCKAAINICHVIIKYVKVHNPIEKFLCSSNIKKVIGH